MICYDLDNTDVVIVKDWDSLITLLTDLLVCCNQIKANTDTIEAQLTAQIVLLTSLDTELLAQGVTLDSILADTTSIIAQLTTLNGKDYATETTLALIDSVLDSIKVDTGNMLTSLGTEATLLDIETVLDGIASELALIYTNLQLNTITTATLGTETTLAAIKAKTDLLNFTGVKLRTTGEDGGGGGGGSSINDKLLQVDSVAPNTTYLGYADAGSLTSAVVWAIKRIIETGNDVSITWADGDNSFDNIWDNRLILSYS